MTSSSDRLHDPKLTFRRYSSRPHARAFFGTPTPRAKLHQIFPPKFAFCESSLIRR